MGKEQGWATNGNNLEEADRRSRQQQGMRRAETTQDRFLPVVAHAAHVFQEHTPRAALQPGPRLQHAQLLPSTEQPPPAHPAWTNGSHQHAVLTASALHTLLPRLTAR